MDEGEELTLTPTAFDHIIERPRLITALEKADARVVLFCAPAGYGKTTLARQWSTRQKRQPVWYRTTRASGDVAALAVGLDNLLAGAGAPKNRDPSRIASIASVNPRPEPLARALVSTYRRLPKDLLLVVDEYEAADTAEAEELFAALVEGLPIRFLFTSRTRPRWFEPRLTVYGEAMELGVEELTMTDEEAETVLELGRRGKPDRAIVERAQGWPAVLGLAAMSSESDLPADKLLPRALYDFLASELLEATPAEVQEALLLLAAASVDSVAVARALLRDRWRLVLDAAERQRLIIVGTNGDISLHPLLRELLLMHLRDVDHREALAHRLEPLIEQRRWDEALAAAEALPVSRFVTLALTAALEDLLRGGRTETLRRWAAAGKAAGISREIVDYIESELALRDADFDKALLLGGRAAGRLSGQLAARAHLCAARAAHLCERRERAAEHAAAAQALATERRTLLDAVWARFTQAADGELPEVAEIFREFAAIADDSDETELRLAMGKLLLAQHYGGLEEALDEAGIALALTGREADPHVETGFLMAIADASVIRAFYTDALAATRAARELAIRYQMDFVHRYALHHSARALVGLKRVAEAANRLRELDRILKRSPDSYSAASVGNLRASLYLTVGDLERAQAALTFDPAARVSSAQRAERLGLLALTLAARGHATEAVASADRAASTSTACEPQTLAALTKSLVALAEGSDDCALEAASVAIDYGALHQLVLALRVSPQLARLLTSRGDYRALLTDVLIRSNDADLAQQAGLNVPRSVRRTETLSPREHEIHGLIAQGLTNREIANLLFISPSTAKVHVHHVLEKLGVRSRIEAARLWDARENDG
jgi:LuxR family maltose regulon positive regulatory protein